MDFLANETYLTDNSESSKERKGLYDSDSQGIGKKQ